MQQQLYPPHQEEQPRQQQQPCYWNDEWREFLIALQSPSQPFYPFHWIYRLSKASFFSLYHGTSLSVLIKFLRLDRIGWRSIIPVFAIWLIVVVVFGGYFGSVRSFLNKRWCEKSITTTTIDDGHPCPSNKMIIHDITVTCFGIMILWNYLYTMFASPGVYIPPCVNDDALVMGEVSPTVDYVPYSWKASKSQGGFIGCDPIVDVKWERRRLARDYGDLSTLDTTSCRVCQIRHRPPRCHHCHTCQRCVLRYDHHCIWLNNCIGYYNYRTFLLTLFYLSSGSLYGVCLLFHAFYDPLAQQIREHGMKWVYSNQTGFLDIPSPIRLVQELIRTGSLDPNVVIKMVYPILLGVMVILGNFLLFHLTYVIRGCTTLEYKIFRDQQRYVVGDGNVLKNPFDQGWKANLVHVLGGSRGILFAFLPIPINLPAPVLPVSDDQKIR